MITSPCARCGRSLLGIATGESALYSPNRSFELCEPCFFEEDKEIEQRGTNNIPARVDEYKANIRRRLWS